MLPFHFLRLVSLKGWLIANVILLLNLFLMSEFTWAKQGAGHIALDVLDKIVSIAIVVGVLAHFLPGPVLYLERRDERKTFLSVHGYDLLKGAFLLMLGSVLTIIAQLVVKSMK